MNHHGHDKNTDMAIATQSFANEYQKRHPYVSPGAVRVVVELSRLSAVVNAEDAPLGSLELLSDADRERRAKLVGKRLGAKKDAIKWSEFLFRDPDDEMAVAREQVAAACDNPEYQAYILKEGPLFLDELGGASEELATVIARYGWPDEIDGVIKAPPRYETDVEFMRGLKKQLGNGPSLSNHPFLHMLGAPLIDSYEEVARLGLRGIDLNGATPSLHRAHAVAPDLIDGARVIVNKMMSRYSHYKILPSEEFIERMRSPELSHDEDPLLDGYLTPGNEDICRALHMSYQLMARLLKVDDFSRIDQSDDFKGRHIDATSALRGLE